LPNCFFNQVRLAGLPGKRELFPHGCKADRRYGPDAVET
jgi:hypothetical protein